MAKRILITTDSFGRSNGELGKILMRSFLVSLAHDETPPASVMLVNDGVRLACEGSDALGELRKLVGSGTAVRACGTCLNHLDLVDKLEVGEAGDMRSLVEAVCGPDEVVTIS